MYLPGTTRHRKRTIGERNGYLQPGPVCLRSFFASSESWCSHMSRRVSLVFENPLSVSIHSFVIGRARGFQHSRLRDIIVNWPRMIRNHAHRRSRTKLTNRISFSFFFPRQPRKMCVKSTRTCWICRRASLSKVEFKFVRGSGNYFRGFPCRAVDGEKKKRGTSEGYRRIYDESKGSRE